MLILTHVVSIMMNMDLMMAHMDMIVKFMCVVIETTYARVQDRIHMCHDQGHFVV